MKILRVIASMKPEGGGPAQGIRNSIPEMGKIGVINEVVCFDTGYETYCGSDPFTIHYLGLGKSPYKYNNQLKPWLKGNFHNYDAVVIHGMWLYNSYGTYRAWKEYVLKNNHQLKLFLMPHGMLDPYFQKAKDRKLKSIRNFFIWHLFEKHIINNSDGVLFTCIQELILARQTFSHYYPKSELNVSYGIQAPPILDINKVNENIKEVFPQIFNKKYLLFLSRVHSKKGIDLLLRAFISLKQEGNTLPDLVVAGPGLDTEYGNELLEIVNGDKQIHFVGMVKGELKWSLLYGTELFILPSHQENFGIAIVEAMACGKGVIISDKVNIYKEIESGGAGLVSNDTAEGVKLTLNKYLNLSVEQKNLLGMNAQNVYVDKFSITQAAKVFACTIQNHIEK